MRTRAWIVAAALLAVAAATSPVAAARSSASAPAGAESLGNGYYAVPLEAPVPEWYTSQLHRRVVAAAARGEGVALPAEAAEYEASGLLFTGIRPGSWMISPSGCTMSWVYGSATGTFGSGTEASSTKSGSRPTDNGNGSRPTKSSSSGSGVYIETAGHCTEAGDEVVIVAAPGILMNIGKTVKSVDGGVGNDYAFVEIRTEMVQYVNPSMAHFGGPTGAEAPLFGDPIVHSGHGLVIGTGGTPRAGLVTYDEGSNGSAYGWDGAAIFGDSGSPVRHATGNAAGNLTHLIVDSRWLPAFIGGTTITKILSAAPAPLATAPPLPDPLW